MSVIAIRCCYKSESIGVSRYLECNRALTRQKRDEARKLREALRNLQSRLDRYIKVDLKFVCLQSLSKYSTVLTIDFWLRESVMHVIHSNSNSSKTTGIEPHLVLGQTILLWSEEVFDILIQSIKWTIQLRIVIPTTVPFQPYQHSFKVFETWFNAAVLLFFIFWA